MRTDDVILLLPLLQAWLVLRVHSQALDSLYGVLSEVVGSNHHRLESYTGSTGSEHSGNDGSIECGSRLRELH